MTARDTYNASVASAQSTAVNASATGLNALAATYTRPRSPAARPRRLRRRSMLCRLLEKRDGAPGRCVGGQGRAALYGDVAPA